MRTNVTDDVGKLASFGIEVGTYYVTADISAHLAWAMEND